MDASSTRPASASPWTGTRPRARSPPAAIISTDLRAIETTLASTSAGYARNRGHPIGQLARRSCLIGTTGALRDLSTPFLRILRNPRIIGSQSPQRRGFLFDEIARNA